MVQDLTRPPIDPQDSKNSISESFNNWASGSAAVLSLIVAGFSVYLTFKINNVNEDLRNLEANRQLSELVGTSIQHLVSADKKLQRDLAVIAITSALRNKNIPEHHNLLLGYGLTRRIALNTIDDIKNLEEGKLEKDVSPNLNNNEEQEEQNQTITYDIPIDIVYEKNTDLAIRLDEVIENYEDSSQTKLRNRRCDIAEELNVADRVFQCSDDFSYRKEAENLRNNNLDILASSTISSNELENKTEYQVEANNKARDVLNTILNSSNKEALVNVYSNSNSAKTKLVDKAFNENDDWLVPNQIVQTEVPRNMTNSILYYGAENQHLADNLLRHLQNTFDSDTQESIGPLEAIDASEQLQQIAEQKKIDIRIPDKQLEIWLTTPEKTEEEENSTKIK